MGDITSTGGVASGFAAIGDSGTFTGCVAEGSVSGTTAGGFIGSIIPNASNIEMSISGCEAIGTVTGTDLAAGFVGNITVSGANDTNATNVTIQNSVPARLDKENSGANAEIVDFAKQTVPDGSNSHLTSAENSTNPYGFGAKVAIFRWFDEAEQKYKLWMCAGIDSLEYKEVGFIITVGNRTEKFVITTVYTSVEVNIDGVATVLSASEFATEEFAVQYIFWQAISFSNVGENTLTYQIYAEKLDGTIVYGQPKETQITHDDISNG